MFQSLIFIVLAFLRNFLDGLPPEASDKINWLFIEGRSRTRLLETSSFLSRAAVKIPNPEVKYRENFYQLH